jgi:hypothetical protein
MLKEKPSLSAMAREFIGSHKEGSAKEFFDWLKGKGVKFKDNTAGTTFYTQKKNLGGSATVKGRKTAVAAAPANAAQPQGDGTLPFATIEDWNKQLRKTKEWLDTHFKGDAEAAAALLTSLPTRSVDLLLEAVDVVKDIASDTPKKK